jgi:hypothetical protein
VGVMMVVVVMMMMMAGSLRGLYRTGKDEKRNGSK